LGGDRLENNIDAMGVCRRHYFSVVTTVCVRHPIREGITGANGCGESEVGGPHDLPSSSDISDRVRIGLVVSQSKMLAERCHYPVNCEERQLG
jgi:hypothetical protein